MMFTKKCVGSLLMLSPRFCFWTKFKNVWQLVYIFGKSCFLNSVFLIFFFLRDYFYIYHNFFFFCAWPLNWKKNKALVVTIQDCQPLWLEECVGKSRSDDEALCGLVAGWLMVGRCLCKFYRTKIGFDSKILGKNPVRISAIRLEFFSEVGVTDLFFVRTFLTVLSFDAHFWQEGRWMVLVGGFTPQTLIISSMPVRQVGTRSTTEREIHPKTTVV